MRVPNQQSQGLYDLIHWVEEKSDKPLTQSTLIEIGSYTGESAIIFSKYFKTVISVDPFLNHYDENDPACHMASFDEVYTQFLINTLGIDNIKSIRLKSDDAFNILDTTVSPHVYDMVYIDGCHTYECVFRDITLYKQLIRQGGFLAGHDFNYKPVNNAIKDSIGLECIHRIFQDKSWVVHIV